MGGFLTPPPNSVWTSYVYGPYLHVEDPTTRLHHRCRNLLFPLSSIDASKMVNFNGKYKWVKNEDFDEYLEKMGEILNK